jgi:hypothetical protein
MMTQNNSLNEESYEFFIVEGRFVSWHLTKTFSRLLKASSKVSPYTVKSSMYISTQSWIKSEKYLRTSL